MKTLASMGENAFVAAVIKSLPSRPDVRTGAGDDCAVVGGQKDAWWRLMKADAVIEGIHFVSAEKPERVGWKALCRAISDIAAMGGFPEHALVTVALRVDTDFEWARGLYRGLCKAARKYGVAIVGGETCRSPGPAFINVTLNGRVERTACTLRSGGKPGDLLYVTGTLGGSIRGKHLDFTPRLAEARWLVQHAKPSAMMDISDGLAADLPRLAQSSGCGFELWEDKLPCTPGRTPKQALSDGEDFELLFAISPKNAPELNAWAKNFPRLRLTQIGKLTRRTRRNTTSTSGYDHFTKSR